MFKTITIAVALGLTLSANLLAAPININTATNSEMAKNLPGIGKKKAQLIIEERERLGGKFTNHDQLAIKGVGKSVITKNKGNILFTDPKPNIN